MNQAPKSLATLADVEREVVAEYRELGRQQLERRLRALADQTGEVFPPAPTQTASPDPAYRAGIGETDL